MGIFSRIFSVGKSQAHALVEKFEDPIKMTEQGIRDLQKDMGEAMKALAQVKSLSIRTRREADDANKILLDYERKAMLLLTRGKEGSIAIVEAERLATEALTKKEEFSKKTITLANNAHQYEEKAAQIQMSVNKLRTTIGKYDAELITLKARAKTAACTRKVNEQLARVDSNGTIAMLERMKEKVQEDESLAEAYGEIAVSRDLTADDEINKALDSSTTTALTANTSDKLAELKAKMGI